MKLRPLRLELSLSLSVIYKKSSLSYKILESLEEMDELLILDAGVGKGCTVLLELVETETGSEVEVFKEILGLHFTQKIVQSYFL